jgi:hypothetical protein
MTESATTMSDTVSIEWINAYAEALGCEARPGAVAAAIENLKGERDSAMASIPEHRKRAEDGIIRQMRRAAVNCGHSSDCYVAHQFETSDERSNDSD